MAASAPFKEKSNVQKGLLVAGIILIALNLRPALASIGPLISFIRADTGLSNTMLGMLTALPLLAFGFLSTLTPLFTKRWGMEGVLAGSLALLTTGIFLRVIPAVWALFGGTLLLGIGIALGNVLLPAVVKRDFARHTGIMTSLYSSMLGIGAAIAAGFSVPLARELGWHWSLGVWGFLSLFGLLVWLPQLKNLSIPPARQHFFESLRELLSDKMAWQVALFMGLQSLAFYVILAWLPDLLQDRGLDPDAAGWMLSLSQGMGVAGTLLMPVWAEKMADQRKPVWILVILEIISFTGLMFPDPFLVGLWVSLIGFTLGGSFGLALLFIVLRTHDSEKATGLSGMAQSIGYLLAAAGPALFGALHDLTKGWFLPLLFLLIVALAKLIAGLGAGKDSER